MTAINITVTGNLTDDPQLRYTPTGVPAAQFTVASNERYRGNDGQWQDGPTSFVRCNAWRDLADHAAESLSKGDRVVVTGTLRQRDYEAKDGTKRTVWEVAVAEVATSLRYATVKISRARRDGGPVPEDPWASTSGPGPVDPAALPADEPPF
jgi:single-strand DNA-binding protein